MPTRPGRRFYEGKYIKIVRNKHRPSRRPSEPRRVQSGAGWPEPAARLDSDFSFSPARVLAEFSLAGLLLGSRVFRLPARTPSGAQRGLGVVSALRSVAFGSTFGSGGPLAVSLRFLAFPAVPILKHAWHPGFKPRGYPAGGGTRTHPGFKPRGRDVLIQGSPRIGGVPAGTQIGAGLKPCLFPPRPPAYPGAGPRWPGGFRGFALSVSLGAGLKPCLFPPRLRSPRGRISPARGVR